MTDGSVHEETANALVNTIPRDTSASIVGVTDNGLPSEWIPSARKGSTEIMTTLQSLQDNDVLCRVNTNKPIQKTMTAQNVTNPTIRGTINDEPD